MKKFLLLLATVFTLHAGDIEWFFDYNEAMKSAQKEHKNILVFMSQPGCGTCEYMKENVFVDKDVETYINRNFVALNLNVYDEDVPHDLKVRVTPVFHFLDAEGKPVHAKLIGGKTAPFFLKLLQEARGETGK